MNLHNNCIVRVQIENFKHAFRYRNSNNSSIVFFLYKLKLTNNKHLEQWITKYTSNRNKYNSFMYTLILTLSFKEVMDQNFLGIYLSTHPWDSQQNLRLINVENGYKSSHLPVSPRPLLLYLSVCKLIPVRLSYFFS